MIKTAFAVALLASAASLLSVSSASAEENGFISLSDDPDYLSFGVGYYDVIHQDGSAAEFRAEYRSDLLLWFVKPFAGVAATTTGDFFVGVGLLVDIDIGSRLVLTGSVAPFYYSKGSEKNLGYPLEFREEIELSYRFDDRSRLGVSFSHYSNAWLGDENPGADTVMVRYSLPVSHLLGR
jgi:hypothetical protein